MRLNSVLLRSTVVAALGGLLFGFDTVVISGTTQALTDQQITDIVTWLASKRTANPGQPYRTNP